jgi:sugar phosphate permease
MLQDASTGMDPGGIGTLLTLCSFFYLFGKISMGYGVDRCGARFVFLWLASFASSGLTYLMSASASSARMTLIMCALCIAQSSGEEVWLGIDILDPSTAPCPHRPIRTHP